MRETVLFFSNFVVTWTFEDVFYEFLPRYVDFARKIARKPCKTCLIGGTRSLKYVTRSWLIGKNFMSAERLTTDFHNLTVRERERERAKCSKIAHSWLRISMAVAFSIRYSLLLHGTLIWILLLAQGFYGLILDTKAKLRISYQVIKTLCG